NDRPVRCRAVAGLEAATVLTRDPLNPERYQPGSGYEPLIRRARLVRTWGDGYGYLLVAGGWADVMLDPVMNPWDIAALVPILRGAGGVITDWQGGSAYPASSTVAAATPALHAAVLAALRGGPPGAGAT
ncbi:MAG: inositol monophosphatase family protein, partial [Verrucomicrobiota bacterium]